MDVIDVVLVNLQVDDTDIARSSADVVHHHALFFREVDHVLRARCVLPVDIVVECGDGFFQNGHLFKARHFCHHDGVRDLALVERGGDGDGYIGELAVPALHDGLPDGVVADLQNVSGCLDRCVLVGIYDLAPHVDLRVVEDAPIRAVLLFVAREPPHLYLAVCAEKEYGGQGLLHPDLVFHYVLVDRAYRGAHDVVARHLARCHHRIGGAEVDSDVDFVPHVLCIIHSGRPPFPSSPRAGRDSPPCISSRDS